MVSIFKLLLLVFLIVVTGYTAFKYIEILRIKNKKVKRGLYTFLYFFQFMFILRFFLVPRLTTHGWPVLFILWSTSVFFMFIILSFIFFAFVSIYNIIQKRMIRKWYVPRRDIIMLLMVFSIIIGTYSTIHARVITTQSYYVHVQKESIHSELRIAYISDLHLGNSVDIKKLKKIVDDVNNAEPDLVLFGGDIFDELTNDYHLKKSVDVFKQLTPTYGSYYVFGNHEEHRSNLGIYYDALEAAGITPIVDDVMVVADDIQLIGRDDYTKHKDRPSLKSLAKKLDQSKPIIVLDHQPIIDDYRDIDLQLSGHTHDGQIFPYNLLVAIQFPHSYGYFKEPYQMITSSGAGTWGVPARLGSDSEIVIINMIMDR
ncbi:hypothetical protein EDD63_10610 [Breznakia blatticola]|uniref:Calcineurin-like phosphoesterase domain-containing protein n=1 Tax=Breznakia blatticola TaxID=1754012 RepID=A0A4R8A3B4_9FIRM|nr:metallophosphoesterase [Breznakia blatticola]TDW25069.1 hypothetical protein EDD63_10610 [Breznakia blatticola]